MPSAFVTTPGGSDAVFAFTIDTTKSGTSSDSGFALPLGSFQGDYDFTVDWGDSTSDYITSYNQPEVSHTYADTGIYTISISGIGVTGLNNWTVKGDRLKFLNIESWGKDVMTFKRLGSFRGCENLTCNATGTPTLIGDCSEFFYDCHLLRSGVKDFDMSQVIRAAGFFRNAYLFNDDITGWNMSSVVRMNSFLQEAWSFNRDISVYDTSSVEDFRYCFAGTHLFDQPVSLWDYRKAYETDFMFLEALSFNNGGQPFANIRFEQIFAMNGMFKHTPSMVVPVTGLILDTPYQVDMGEFFFGTGSVYNQDIKYLLAGAASNIVFDFVFFQNPYYDNGGVTLSGFGANHTGNGKIINLQYAFSESIFNQSVVDMDVSSVLTMEGTFLGNTGFDQDLSSWVPTANRSFFNFMGQANVTPSYEIPSGRLSVENYSATLIAWSQLSFTTTPYIELNANFGLSQYSCEATGARAILTGSPNLWPILDGGLASGCDGSEGSDSLPVSNTDISNWDVECFPSSWYIC